MNEITRSTWCPLPWMSLNVRNNGDVRVCCNANTSQGQGLVADDNGSLYNLGHDSLQDFRNAKLMRDIRLAILNNQYHPACIRCEREDAAGMESRRIWENKIWEHVITEDHARQTTAADGTISIENYPLRYADLRFGNLCNLKCRMCGPTDSNQWYDDHVAVWNTSTYTDSGQKIKLIKKNNGYYEPETSIYEWYKNDNFWNELEHEIPNLERLYIVGGEPLLIDQHYEFLQKCVDSGHAHRILVEYNTNLTNIPKRAWDIWKHFGKIQIGASIDGVGPINDYIRYPSKWRAIESNLKRLDDAEGNFKIWWAATIQAYNMVHLPDMMLWKIKQNYKRINSPRWLVDRPVITPHPLHKPDFLNVKIFPASAKQHIIDLFDTAKVSAKSVIYSMDFYDAPLVDFDIKDSIYSTFVQILDRYVKYMIADDYTQHLDKFWQYTERLDDLRGQSLRDVCPITYDLLRNY